jgi:hypothetical protein
MSIVPAGRRALSWRDDLISQAKNHPLRTFAIIAGVGYVVGGGLFSRMTIRMVAMGMRFSPRLAWVPLFSRGVVSLLQGTLRDKHNRDESHKMNNEQNKKGD